MTQNIPMKAEPIKQHSHTIKRSPNLYR